LLLIWTSFLASRTEEGRVVLATATGSVTCCATIFTP
jgi:hypothetical protein